MVAPIRVAVLVVCGVFATRAFASSAIDVSIDAERPHDIVVEVRTDPSALTFEIVELGGREFVRVAQNEGLNIDDVGLPDLPTIHRLVAHDPTRYYEVVVEALEPTVLEGVLLAPVQPDAPDTGARLPFRINDDLYDTDTEIGSETVQLGDQIVLAGLPVLPLRLTPIHYNPRAERLTIWKTVRARVYASEKRRPRENVAASMHLTSFAASQIRALVENFDHVLKRVPKSAADAVLVLTTPDLEAKARELAAAHPWAATVVPVIEVVQRGVTSTTIKDRILAHYNAGGLDSVLLFGDESQIALHQWTSSLPGDSFYQFLDGNDWYADVALARLPVSDSGEADVVLRKLRDHHAREAAGFINKRTLLVAHKEQYPEKYTANMERVRTAPNPRGLAFDVRYGGRGALNLDVTNAVDLGYAIVNYRGHGSSTTWSGWASDSSSFGLPEIASLANFDDRNAVFFSIACSNGALHETGPSFAEQALFHEVNGESAGAVAILAATILSSTTTNHKFNEHLFTYLQNDENLRLGNIVALANNRLVRDNGGSILNNVKMYILFGDPLLRPLIAAPVAATN